MGACASMPVFVYVWHWGECTPLYFHLRLSGRSLLHFPEMASTEKQTWSVLFLPMLSWLIVLALLSVHTRDFSRAPDMAAEVCSETTAFWLMSLGCSPQWITEVRQTGWGIQSDYFLWLQSCLNKCFLAVLMVSLASVIQIFTSL